MTRRRTATVALLAGVLLAGCGGLKQGPAGKVVARDRTYWPATKQWTYELTTEDARGERHEFRVKRHVYKVCFRHSTYPNCIHRHDKEDNAHAGR
ncbi:hypothetical protein AB0D90_14580 [Streptomyces althioticus]|uniref:hypothetical protein n=1 Tax=Streptomyces althioticus TaxID=83380 RepID=UPI0033D57972